MKLEFWGLGRPEIVIMENERKLTGDPQKDFSPATSSSPKADSKIPFFFPALGFCQVDVKENSAEEDVC